MSFFISELYTDPFSSLSHYLDGGCFCVLEVDFYFSFCVILAFKWGFIDWWEGDCSFLTPAWLKRLFLHQWINKKKCHIFVSTQIPGKAKSTQKLFPKIKSVVHEKVICNQDKMITQIKQYYNNIGVQVGRGGVYCRCYLSEAFHHWQWVQSLLDSRLHLY